MGWFKKKTKEVKDEKPTLNPNDAWMVMWGIDASDIASMSFDWEGRYEDWCTFFGDGDWDVWPNMEQYRSARRGTEIL